MIEYVCSFYITATSKSNYRIWYKSNSYRYLCCAHKYFTQLRMFIGQMYNLLIGHVSWNI